MKRIEDKPYYTSAEMADLEKHSMGYLRLQRHLGYGPPFIRVLNGNIMEVRYLKREYRLWKLGR